MDNLDSGLRTPEVKSSKRLKVSLSVPAVLGSSNAGIKREAENFDFESGASPPFELNNEHIKISAQPVKELRPSAARSHGLREAKEEPADYTAGLNVAASLPLYAPNSNQAPQRLLRSQTKASQKESIKEETPSKVSTDIDQRKPAGSRKRNFQNVQEEPLQTVAPVTPQPQVLNGRGSASQPAVKMELSLAKQTSSSFPQASKLPLTQTSASLQITQAQPPGETAGHSSVLDSLVRTILSQNTTDTNSKRAFASLKQAFPTWEDVRAAGPGPLAASIKSGGLAEIKARRILDILEHLASKYGALELEHLRSMSDEQVKAELSQFKGVGPKTVACVLMFCLDRNEFPVDTHVWRISKRLGWVPQTADREATYLHLNQRVPDDVKYDLHCLLVGHGKKCPGCAKGGRPQKAPDGPCPLTPWIRGAGKGDKK
ncbi:hypothetical protein KFL_005620010 [Klebsormidium nitens]|uniref:HhH-GPD domain-containing protein n=1 Tax=Klebsormidium nitens TaxID=105231 RepID=A0A1Y1IGL5_KLENI|nr:hypothetical protein KFL_005620010 [Klebsormidium nitens]|eukprot:GAQ89783.1 hypothetical protein KFL_005620010 [Klebsormidium nitens]